MKKLFLLSILFNSIVFAQTAELNRDNQSAISFLPENGDSIFHIAHGLNNDLNISQGTNVGGTSIMTIKNYGSIGIGTTSPLTKLHVNGRMILNDGTIQKGGIPITNTTDLGLYSHLSGHWIRIVSNNAPIRFFTDIGNGGAGSDAKMSVEANGNVGIGTIDTKGFKLGVNGKIAATEVKVASYTNWADFVFNKGYNLPTLQEVEQHIKEKGHLKDIPNAEEVKKDGFYLAEMNARLLQKIEELTLYTIEQEKKLETQSNEIKKLKEESKILKTLMERVKKLENNKKS